MKTQLLPPVANASFNHEYGSLPRQPLMLLHHKTKIPQRPSIGDIVHGRVEASSASLGPRATTPSPRNDQENAGTDHLAAIAPPSLLGIDSQDRDTRPKRPVFTVPKTPAPIDLSTCDGREQHASEEENVVNTLPQGSLQDTDQPRVSEDVPSVIRTPFNKQISSPMTDPMEDRCNISIHESSSHSSLGSMHGNAQPPQLEALPLTGLATDSPIVDRSPFWHQPRLSTNSSGVVHTVKTASFSIGSFSALSRSLRLGHSIDTRGMISSHSRFSSDSERPPTTSSIEEAALWRAVKRRQVLDEIVSTEEGYVTDLRALVYLMSTLLASGTSLPNSVRASVQQNVLDLMHLHETILENCHRAALKSAARKWADTLSNRRLRSPLRLRRFEPVVVGEPTQARRRIRSSIDSTDLSTARIRVNGAESADIGDLIGSFTSLATCFLSYEEYTANHGLVAHDLQRHLPSLWSTYGAGMESLARSVVSLDRRECESRKGLTVGDLLIKPIQRVCKYPLLFQELLRVTPVADCPLAHAEIESLLQRFRSLVEAVNDVTRSPEARLHIQRRWLLQSRLHFGCAGVQPEKFRDLGNVILCGVLHITYQTKLMVDGLYALCVLFPTYFLLAFPSESPGRFEIVALIRLCDLKIESPMDGKGLQCPSALHTWKVCFSVGGNLYEFVLSACSVTEEEQWTKGLRGELESSLGSGSRTASTSPATTLALELKSVGTIYSHQGPLSRRLSIQRAATVGNRVSICQVLVRNTNNPEEFHDFRPAWTSAINRSQSHLSTNRLVILAPKRSERVKLEASLGDVWTKDKLPYPGMVASRGGQIIRASAGSLVRKLSLASIHAPFSRRSTSLSLSSRKSCEALSGSRRSRDKVPTFSIRRDSFNEKPQPRAKRCPEDFRELDTMDSVIHRMIGDHNDAPLLDQCRSQKKEAGTKHHMPICPDDPADIFYRDQGEDIQEEDHRQPAPPVQSGKKRRWSNPIARLKAPLKEGLRGLVYASK